MNTARSHRAKKSGSPNFESNRRRPASLGVSESTVEICECTAELGKFEMESAFQKSLWPAASSGESEMRLSAHEERADVRGPGRNGRAPGAVQSAPQLAHKLGVRDRIRPGYVVNSRDLG